MSRYGIAAALVALVFGTSTVVSLRAVVGAKDSANCMIQWRISNGGAYILKCATDHCDEVDTPNCYIFSFSSGGHQHYSCACCAGLPPGTNCNTPAGVLCYGDIDAYDPYNYTVTCTTVACQADAGCLVSDVTTSSWRTACYCP